MANEIFKCPSVSCEAGVPILLEIGGFAVDPALNPVYQWSIVGAQWPASVTPIGLGETAELVTSVSGCYVVRVLCCYDKVNC